MALNFKPGSILDIFRAGKLVPHKVKSPEFGHITLYRADARLSEALPRLALPPMQEAARAAFRAVIEHEKPASNGAMASCLGLAEARGYSAHPGDWIPFFDHHSAGGHPPLYQPWMDWLSDNGLTPYHEGNTLTEVNWSRWKPKPREAVWHRMGIEQQDRAFDMLRRVAPLLSAAVREGLLRQINAGGSFYGNYPRQMPLLECFLEDRTPRIRDLAREKLDAMAGFETTAAHASVLACHLKITGTSVTMNDDARSPPNLYRHWSCATIDELSAELGLSAPGLVGMADLEALGSMFNVLVCSTGDLATRAALAERQLKGPSDGLSLDLFAGLDRPLRERGLKALCRSHSWNSVQEFLGPEMGTLSVEQMHEMQCWDALERGSKGANNSYDPVRVVAFSVNREAAEVALEQALSQRIEANDPRLTMLKFNLALETA